MKSEKKDLKAAALKYPENAPAPFVVAKGKKHTAERIIKLAKENNIPLMKDVKETDVITLAEIGECIPEQTYETLAKIFAFIKEIEDETGN